jgi:hypothetical protein
VAPKPTAEAPPGSPEESPEASARRRWILPIVLSIAMASGGIGALVIVPTSHAVSTSFVITTPYNTTNAHSVNRTFSHAGTFDFSWSASDSTIQFEIQKDGGSPIFTTFSSSGSSSIVVSGGVPYEFSITNRQISTTTVAGTLHYRAPAL